MVVVKDCILSLEIVYCCHWLLPCLIITCSSNRSTRVQYSAGDQRASCLSVTSQTPVVLFAGLLFRGDVLYSVCRFAAIELGSGPSARHVRVEPHPRDV